VSRAQWACYLKLCCEIASYLQLTDQKRALIESFAPHPRGYLEVAFTGITWATGWNNIRQRVAPTTRDCSDAIALQSHVPSRTVGTATPGLFHGQPLLVGEIVLNSGQPATSLPREPRFSISSHRHWCSLVASGLINPGLTRATASSHHAASLQ
jgi:hypothetical protein